MSKPLSYPRGYSETSTMSLNTHTEGYVCDKPYTKADSAIANGLCQHKVWYKWSASSIATSMKDQEKALVSLCV